MYKRIIIFFSIATATTTVFATQINSFAVTPTNKNKTKALTTTTNAVPYQAQDSATINPKFIIKPENKTTADAIIMEGQRRYYPQLADLIAKPVSSNDFYLGLQAGIAAFATKGHIIKHNPDESTAAQASITSSSSAFTGEINLGYGRKIKRFFIGLQLATLLNNFNKKLTLPNNILNPAGADLTLETKYGFGAGIRPGFYVKPNLLFYGYLGIALSKFTTKPSVSSSFYQIADNSSNRMGWSLGIGLEQYFGKYFSLFGEYRYTQYAQWHDQVQYTSSLNPNIHYTYNFDPPLSSNMFSLGIRVHLM